MSVLGGYEPMSYKLMKIKKPLVIHQRLLGSGSRTRTYDLRVMSPTSYQLLHPALFFVGITFCS